MERSPTHCRPRLFKTSYNEPTNSLIVVYLRKGLSGILLAFGGWTLVYGDDGAAAGYWDQRLLSEIFVYDISSSTWHQQKATGELPLPRTEFCAGVSAAPDDSSFQITIHGGWDGLNNGTYNDVYVLSIPAFRWIKINDSNNPDWLGSHLPGRNRHKCEVWNERQLIVSGGLVTSVTDNITHLNEDRNSKYPPFKVLDTSTYSWRATFDPNLEDYTVPDSVTTIIGGG